MEKEDEEVIFKNSALYDHLVASGYSEFESASCLEEAVHGSAAVSASAEQKGRTLRDGVLAAADWLGLRSSPLLVPAAHAALLRSGLMTDRDRAMAADLCPHTGTAPATAQLPTAALVAAAVAGLASALYLPAPWPLLALLAAAVAGGAAVAGYLRSAGMGRLELFCGTAVELRRTALKCVRLLQESHLMARGVSLSSGQSGAEAAFAAQYGQLLQACGACLRASCAAYAAATRQLRRERPLLEGVDPEPHYLAYDQPELLTASGTTFTVKDVKGLQQLLTELQSELVRRCCLGLSADLLPPDAGGPRLASDLLSQLTSALAQEQRHLSAAYRAHLARWAEPAEVAPAAARPAHRLYVGVHGVCLQAQVVALRARALEDALAGPAQPEDADQEPLPDVASDRQLCSRLRRELEEMARRLQSAGLLCEQTQLQLSRLCDEPPPAALSSPTGAQPAAAPRLVELPEPEIVDQFFEAVVEGDEAPADDAEDQLLSEEERLTRRLQRERARELLRELDGALSSKRQEWRLREAAARGEPPPPPDVPDAGRSAEPAAGRGGSDGGSVSSAPRQTAEESHSPLWSPAVGRNIPDDYKVDPRELYRFSDSDGESPVLPPVGDLAHLLPVQRRARPAAGRRPPSRPTSLAGTPLSQAGGGSGDAPPPAGRPRRPVSVAVPEPGGSPAAAPPRQLRLGFPADLSAQAAAAAQLRRSRRAASDQQDEEVFGEDSD